MATKGPSNRYGNVKGTATIHINYAYVTGKYIGKDQKNHMAKHFSDFGVNNSDDYIAKAVNFGNDIDRINYNSYVDLKGTTYKYNKLNNALLIVSKDGSIVSYYKPRYQSGKNKGKLNWKYYNNHRKKEEDYERKYGKR